VRRQSEVTTPLWIDLTHFKTIQSGVALRLPPHSKFFQLTFIARDHKHLNSLEGVSE
jgi:hypothetical protein